MLSGERGKAPVGTGIKTGCSRERDGMLLICPARGKLLQRALIVGTHDPLCNSGLAVVNREFQRQKMKIPAGEKIFSPDEKYFSPNGNKITPRVFPNNPGLLCNKRALFCNNLGLFLNKVPLMMARAVN